MTTIRMLVAASGFLAASMTGAAFAEDAVPALATPFAGSWMIAFPDAEGVIVNVPDADCDTPAMIEAVSEYRIHVATPGGDMGEWDVMAFGGRNPWWADSGQSLVAEWISEDAFLLAGKDAGGIMSDWANAKQWTRCPLQ